MVKYIAEQYRPRFGRNQPVRSVGSRMRVFKAMVAAAALHEMNEPLAREGS